MADLDITSHTLTVGSVPLAVGGGESVRARQRFDLDWWLGDRRWRVRATSSVDVEIPPGPPVTTFDQRERALPLISRAGNCGDFKRDGVSIPA